MGISSHAFGCFIGTPVRSNKFTGKGRVYCTTQRIIFVAEKGSTQHGLFFEAFVRRIGHTRTEARSSAQLTWLLYVHVYDTVRYVREQEIPLADMTDEKFNQPIFGACSISGRVAPVRCVQLMAAYFALLVLTTHTT